MVQLSQPYMTTGKTTALTKRTFVSKVMSLLFNMLSRFAIAFLPRSEHLLISWLQATSAVILEAKKMKYVTVSTVSPSICYEEMGLDAMILVLSQLFHSPSSLSSRGSLILLGSKIMASSPITSWQIDGETMKKVTPFPWAPKSLQMVTAAVKLKDACSLE